MITKISLQNLLAELSFVKIKNISRHAKGLLLALKKSNRKEILDYEILDNEKCSICGENLYGLVQAHYHNETCKECGYEMIASQSHNHSK